MSAFERTNKNYLLIINFSY